MIKFGTGGWRAIIADNFTKKNVQRLTQAVATKMNKENPKDNTIAVGFDRRF